MSRSALVTTRWSKTKPPESPPATSRSAGSHSLQVGVGEHLLGPVLRRHRRRHPEPERVEVAVERVGLALRRLAADSGSRRRRSPARSASGLPSPVGTMSRGSTTGRSASGTGTGPCSGQWTIGIGVPQERWREIEKSLAR